MTGRLAPPVGASATLADPITVGPDKSIRVDLSKLEAPHNVYDADFAWLEYGSDSVSLLFGKQDRNDSSQLRTRLEVRYSLEAFVRHFWQNSRTFHESLAKFVSDWRFVAKSGDPSKMPAAKDHSEWANFEYIAHAGTEASIRRHRAGARPRRYRPIFT